MYITKLRNEHSEKLSPLMVDMLCRGLQHALTEQGFSTQVVMEGQTRIRISQNGKSFRINAAKLGYNADTGRSGRLCKAGYRRTATPTWDQRVAFNHAVNDTLDRLGYRANIKSGEYIVRTYEDGAVTSWEHYRHANGERVFYEIIPLSEVQK